MVKTEKNDVVQASEDNSLATLLVTTKQLTITRGSNATSLQTNFVALMVVILEKDNPRSTSTSEYWKLTRTEERSLMVISPILVGDKKALTPACSYSVLNYISVFFIHLVSHF